MTWATRFFVPNAISIAGIGCTLWCLVLAKSTGSFDYRLIACAYICDVFDGLAARSLGATSRFGSRLDLLGDTLLYGVTGPLIFVVSANGDLPAVLLGLIAAARVLFVLYKGDRLGHSGVVLTPFVAWFLILPDMLGVAPGPFVIYGAGALAICISFWPYKAAPAKERMARAGARLIMAAFFIGLALSVVAPALVLWTAAAVYLAILLFQTVTLLGVGKTGR